MSTYPPELQFVGSVNTLYWESPYIDCQGFTHIHLMCFSNATHDIDVQWSINMGIDTDYIDSAAAVTGTNTLSLPIRARYMRVVFTSSVNPQVLRLCTALNSNAPGLSILDNAGAGAELYIESSKKIRSLTSTDNSISIQELAETIDLSGASSFSSIVPLTDDVQVTEAPVGQWNIDVGHSANATADSIIFGGQIDYSTSNLGAATGSVILGEGSTALNFTAAQYATSVGYDAGRTPAGINTTAVGNSAGKTAQGASGVSIGYQAGMTSQGTQSVAIGEGAGKTNQGPINVAIGYLAGQTNQTFGSTFNASVAIGYAAASSNQGQMSVAIGPNAASTSQSAEAVAVGRFSGNQNQGLYCVAVGDTAGQYNQKAGGVAIGANSGRGLPGTSFQAGYSVAVGYDAASNGQGSNAVAIGVNAAKGSPDGTNLQGDGAVAIGNTAGQIAQGTYSIAMGYQAGQTGQSVAGIGIGYQAGQTTQGTQSVAIGQGAGQTNQGPYNVAIGYLAGQTNQTAGTAFHGSVAIGIGAAQTSQNHLSVAIGANAGNTTQGEQCVAIGRATAEVTQGSYSVAIGSGAGRYNQKIFSVAIGISAAAGVSSLVGYQDVNSVAIGAGCAQYGQGSNAIAIGAYASQGAVDGSTPQPNASVAIGANCATPGNVGRLAFGNAMEPVTAIGATHEHPIALINMEWNGTHYRIPALSSTATDLHVSMDPMAIGELYYADATGFTTTNLGTAGGIHLAPATTLDTTTSLAGAAYFDEPVNGRLRYLGSTTIKVHAAFSLSASNSNANQSLSFFLKKNGATVSKSVYYFTSPTGGNNFTVAAHAVIGMADNDYLEVWGENTTANNQCTIRNLNLVIMGDGGVV